jgi:hypothetical protein
MNTAILLNDPYNIAPEKTLEFRLVYAGQLLGASRGDTRSAHKHDIRRVFHDQLKTLWDVSPNIKHWEIQTPEGGFSTEKATIRLANRFKFDGVGYIPLSWDGLGVACKLDILMLRPEAPGQTVIRGGDIDNRLKTLFDALRIPQVGEVHEPQGDGREPFFCLLQDDSLINHISVTTDLLLGSYDPNAVHLIITVNLWAVTHTLLNMGIY